MRDGTNISALRKLHSAFRNNFDTGNRPLNQALLFVSGLQTSVMAGNNPTQIFADDVQEEKGENARLSAFVGAIAVGDLVKSTLGPKGMDKILQSASTGEIMVTNDGATILKSIALDNAAAKVLVNISKVQDDEVGDGTTSVTVLAAELLREAEQLVARKIHPQTIIEGYRLASHAALTALEQSAINNSKHPELFQRDLQAAGLVPVRGLQCNNRSQTLDRGRDEAEKQTFEIPRLWNQDLDSLPSS